MYLQKIKVQDVKELLSKNEEELQKKIQTITVSSA